MFPSAQVIGVGIFFIPIDRYGQVPHVTYLLKRGELESESFNYGLEHQVRLGIVGWVTHVWNVVMKVLAPGRCVKM